MHLFKKQSGPLQACGAPCILVGGCARPAEPCAADAAGPAARVPPSMGPCGVPHTCSAQAALPPRVQGQAGSF